MKAGFNWLQEFVSISLTPEEVAERLTMAGLEVESIERIGPGFKGIVVGEILSMEPHPKASDLWLCQVGIRSGTLSIVCGAKNIKTGHRVPVACPGAVLPDGRRIEASRIRGEVSEGMLCSEAELGLGDEAGAIMLLPSDFPIGAEVSKALDLEEVVFEVGVTPNRGDCLSHLGIAREVSALTGVPIRIPSWQFQENGPPVQSLTSVQILDPELCPRYSARIIQGVRIGPSPLWLKRRLQAVGVRPINNVVDITNFVMMELGQPLHAFDYDLLEGRRIVVRQAREGEGLRTLDGVEHFLSPEMLVIADATSPVAIAGIMGGAASEVGPDTRNVLLESANFNPLSIRRTSKILGLTTEASYRFERYVDREGTVRALDRAAYLILETGNGVVARGVVDEYIIRWVPLRLSLRVDRTNRVLGTALKREEMAKTLKALGFSVVTGDGGVLEVTVPSFRHDIQQEIDLVEEVARLHSFERIPTTLPSGRSRAPSQKGYGELKGSIRRVLTSAGFYEAINFSFTKPNVFDKLKIEKDSPLRKAMRIQNPLSEEQAVMRTELLSGLLENLAANENRGVRTVKLFEIGRTYHPEEGSPLPHEIEGIGVIAVGNWSEQFWKGEKEDVDFYHIKGVLAALGEALGLEMDVTSGIIPPYFHPFHSARVVVEERVVGFVGKVHPEVLEAFELRARPYYLELNLEALFGLKGLSPTFKPLPKYPAVVRDIALMVPEKAPAAEIRSFIQQAGGEVVEEVRLFDLYRGEKIPHGYKSLAFSVSYQARDRTLTDEEVNEVHKRILEELKVQIGAVIR